MVKDEFEAMLDDCCERLTEEARQRKFESAHDFEERVRAFFAEAMGLGVVETAPRPQAFPDIAVGEFGVEVKFTSADTWKSIGNSIQETQRVASVRSIYIVFGKMGGIPEVRWADYEASVMHVRTSHVPRFEVDLSLTGGTRRVSLFEKMQISYEDFSKLQMREKMKYIRAYAKTIHPEGHLWWFDEDETDKHSLSVQPRLFKNLLSDEKKKLRAEAALLCPQIVKSGRTRDKYDDVVFYLLTYHGVMCPQVRDLFSAGSVANPQNDDDGGVYIQRALVLIEDEMKEAAKTMEEALFLEYWGESVPVLNRIPRWLEKADAVATTWCPSEVLFLDGR